MMNLWTVLAGAVIFVLGMNFLEDATQMLSGRNFKLFLKKNTANSAKAIGIGTITSGVFQSSSVVNLMVLSLSASGAIPLKNALAVLLGSNLGTTLNTWLLSYLGFRFDIDIIALPVIALSGILRALLKHRTALYSGFTCLLGLGFIMMGLELIKTGMGGILGEIDISMLNRYSVMVGFLFGVVITTLLQSSAATLVILLSALHADVITLYLASAVALGAEIGTTLKFLFVSFGREPAMKRLALGNFLFNLLNAILIILLLIPINRLIADVFVIREPLYALAFFQTLVNLLAIALFGPFLNAWERFLKKRFLKKVNVTRYIARLPLPDTGSAIDTLEREAVYFLKIVLHFAAHITGSEKKLPEDEEVPESFTALGLAEQYNFIKQLHGDIHNYYIAIQDKSVAQVQLEELDRIMSAVRSCIFTAKCLQDIRMDIIHLSKSANEIKYEFYRQYRQFAEDIFSKVSDIISSVDTHNTKWLAEAHQEISLNNLRVLNKLYHRDASSMLSEIEISTVFNFNREFSNALESLVQSAKFIVLDQNEQETFETLVEAKMQ